MRNDAAQETFAVLATQLDRYDQERGRLRHWLRGIAKRKIIDIHRRNRRRKVVSDLSDGSKLLRNLEDPDSTASVALWVKLWERAILQECLRIVRGRVTADTYRAFHRCVIDGIAPAEVAAQLNVEPHIVYSAKHRVMDRITKLKNELEPMD